MVMIKHCQIYTFTTLKTVVVKMMPLMRVMTRGLFRGVWTLWQDTTKTG